jgi:hypothetical protein
MNWTQAIERNRAALVAVVAAVAALIGGRDGDGAIARGLRSAALALLRPAEAAARRLIVIAARGFAVTLGASRPPFPGLAAGALVLRQAQDAGRVERIPAFPLFDRWKRFRPMLQRVQPLGIPRIRSFWSGPQVLASIPTAPPPPAARAASADPDGLVDVRRLRLRLRSLERALGDLTRQARRLARWRARRAGASGGPARSPLRPGRPPGHRQRPASDVDFVLRECHALACDALRADTS